MKILFLLGLFVITNCDTKDSSLPVTLKIGNYQWTQVAGFGNGSFQEEWRDGTFPMGVKPIIAFDSMLWMTGQKSSWYSPDGLQWYRQDKADWIERISQENIYFKNKLWMFGGMKLPSDFQNDIWNSGDGTNWQQAGNAAWSPRKGQSIVVYKNKLWLFGGADKVYADKSPSSFLNDVWSSDDGINWTQEIAAADWSPRDYCRIVIFNDSLWMIGAQGHADIWNSADGKTWKKITDQAAWATRYDYGALVYDKKIWVMGGWPDSPRNALNEVWYSEDGRNWTRQAVNGPWTPRTVLNNAIVFKNKLWIYSGKHTGSIWSWGGDIWTMSMN